jgi:hypothetical protein
VDGTRPAIRSSAPGHRTPVRWPGACTARSRSRARAFTAVRALASGAIWPSATCSRGLTASAAPSNEGRGADPPAAAQILHGVRLPGDPLDDVRGLSPAAAASVAARTAKPSPIATVPESTTRTGRSGAADAPSRAAAVPAAVRRSPGCQLSLGSRLSGFALRGAGGCSGPVDDDNVLISNDPGIVLSGRTVTSPS